MDKYKIDSHKLTYHPDRVAEWMATGDAYPLYMEVSPAGGCNQRCTFCALDFMEYKKRFLDMSIYTTRLGEFAGAGLKSIMYAGEGEPFLHKEFCRMVIETKQSGIDVGITTNASIMDSESSAEIIDSVEWIKVSINAGTAVTYAKIHQCPESHFEKTIKNIGDAIKQKRDKKSRAVIGLQMVLLPDNFEEAVLLAKTGAELGCDYLVVKPYSQHPQSITEQYREVSYKETDGLAKALKETETDTFKVIFRRDTMKVWDEADRGYNCCYALPFWSYLDAGGNLWGCSMYLEDQRFLYGNIYENSFKEIWEGEKRKKSLDFVKNELDINQCRINCRMDKINRYLWDIKNPPEHVNFI